MRPRAFIFKRSSSISVLGAQYTLGGGMSREMVAVGEGVAEASLANY
jgi:hypothetical protein